jgi:putative toxin-antitoxin system antitoxin component (TIGR02293 family)
MAVKQEIPKAGIGKPDQAKKAIKEAYVKQDFTIKVTSGDKSKTAIKEVHFLRGGKLRSLLDACRFSSGDKISIIKEGISKKQLSDIKSEAELDYDDLSEILSTSRATLIGKKGNQTFDHRVSERILLLSDLIAYGREIFGDKDTFNQWLKSPSEALGNVTPLSMMDTVYGAEEVKREIGRIAYGVY